MLHPAAPPRATHEPLVIASLCPLLAGAPGIGLLVILAPGSKPLVRAFGSLFGSLLQQNSSGPFPDLNSFW